MKCKYKSLCVTILGQANKMKKIVLAAALLASGFSAGSASAVTCASLDASTSYDAFTSCVNGMDSETQDRFATVAAIVAALFGDEGYEITSEQSYAPTNGGNGGEFGSLQSSPLFSVAQNTSYSYTFSALPANTLFVAIKNGSGPSGGGFELFRVPASGLPFTLVHSLGQPGFSHFSTFGGTGPSPVPLPAGALLLLGGLGGLIAMRRRRAAA